MRVLTAKQVRQFDQIAVEQFGINSLVLMENAARAACDHLADFSQQNSIEQSAVVLCGPGNNGGDGLVMARHLYIRGWKIKVALLANQSKLSQDTAANLRILTNTKIPISQFDTHGESSRALDEVQGFGWIIDAMLGTGGKAPLRQPMADWIRASNQQDCKKMAIDIPTGLWSEEGSNSAANDLNESGQTVFKADLTVTFVATKPILLTETGKAACGATKIVDIGAPPEVYDFLETET